MLVIRQFSKIPCHIATDEDNVNEIFTVGRAHIKHSITSVIIRLVVDLIFLIFF